MLMWFVVVLCWVALGYVAELMARNMIVHKLPLTGLSCVGESRKYVLLNILLGPLSFLGCASIYLIHDVPLRWPSFRRYTDEELLRMHYGEGVNDDILEAWKEYIESQKRLG